jgi:indole-3-glycerol phosphate synthase
MDVFRGLSMVAEVDHLARIVERKRREVQRRLRHASSSPVSDVVSFDDRAALAHARLRRLPGRLPHVIAEIKHASPSAGVIRARVSGGVAQVAARYAAGGASAVSVLCDRAGFGGSVLDVRRAQSAVRVPILFKEFVLDPVQVGLARCMGAHMVLLLVRALDEPVLHALVDEVLRQGMAPVVEAADDDELAIALRTHSTIVGVNARDLRSFSVDPARASAAIARIPAERIAIHMSGIGSAADLRAVGQTRADAVLVGEALMRAPDPESQLREWLTPAQ